VHRPENSTVDQRLEYARTEDSADDHGAFDESQARPSFDMEETADIVLPADHPIFRR